MVGQDLNGRRLCWEIGGLGGMLTGKKSERERDRGEGKYGRIQMSSLSLRGVCVRDVDQIRMSKLARHFSGCLGAVPFRISGSPL